jgi:hypothetical protein
VGSLGGSACGDRLVRIVHAVADPAHRRLLLGALGTFGAALHRAGAASHQASIDA